MRVGRRIYSCYTYSRPRCGHVLGVRASRKRVEIGVFPWPVRCPASPSLHTSLSYDVCPTDSFTASRRDHNHRQGAVQGEACLRAKSDCLAVAAGPVCAPAQPLPVRRREFLKNIKTQYSKLVLVMQVLACGAVRLHCAGDGG